MPDYAQIEPVDDLGPATGPAVTLISSQVLTQDADDTKSSIVPVRDARACGLWIMYDGDESATTAGEPQIMVWVSGHDDPDIPGAAPAETDDVWFSPGVLDVAPTDAVLGNDTYVPGNLPVSANPEYREYKVGPLVLNLFPTDANNDKVRVMVKLDVAMARWMFVSAVEVGDTTNDGTLQIEYNLGRG